MKTTRERMLECVLQELLEGDVGIYPKAIRTGDPGDYEERSEYQNGWNAGVMAVIENESELFEILGVQIMDDGVYFT